VFYKGVALFFSRVVKIPLFCSKIQRVVKVTNLQKKKKLSFRIQTHTMGFGSQLVSQKITQLAEELSPWVRLSGWGGGGSCV